MILFRLTVIDMSESWQSTSALTPWFYRAPALSHRTLVPLVTVPSDPHAATTVPNVPTFYPQRSVFSCSPCSQNFSTTSPHIPFSLVILSSRLCLCLQLCCSGGGEGTSCCVRELTEWPSLFSHYQRTHTHTHTHVCIYAHTRTP